MTFQDLVQGVSRDHAIEGVIVGAAIAISKIYDILRGRHADSDRRSKHSDILTRFEEHAAADNLAFQNIDAGQEAILSELRHLSTTVGDTKVKVEKIETREFERLQRAAERFAPGSGFPPPGPPQK